MEQLIMSSKILKSDSLIYWFYCMICKNFGRVKIERDPLRHRYSVNKNSLTIADLSPEQIGVALVRAGYAMNGSTGRYVKYFKGRLCYISLNQQNCLSGRKETAIYLGVYSKEQK